MSDFKNLAETITDKLIENGFDVDQYDSSSVEYVKELRSGEQVVFIVDHSRKEAVRKRYNKNGTEVGSETVNLSNSARLNQALALIS